MEEIQSTGVLDREILEDARKKARRTLKAARDQIEQAEASWAKRGAESLEALDLSFERRFESARAEIMARLPLDRKRTRLAKVDGLLRGAGRDFLEALDGEKALALLESAFAERAGDLGTPPGEAPPAGEGGPSGGTLFVRYRHIEPAALRRIVAARAPGWPLELEEERPAEGDFAAFSADSGAVRVRVSLEEALEELLDTRRAELAAALLGKEALDV